MSFIMARRVETWRHHTLESFSYMFICTNGCCLAMLMPKLSTLSNVNLALVFNSPVYNGWHQYGFQEDLASLSAKPNALGFCFAWACKIPCELQCCIQTRLDCLLHVYRIQQLSGDVTLAFSHVALTANKMVSSWHSVAGIFLSHAKLVYTRKISSSAC